MNLGRLSKSRLVRIESFDNSNIMGTSPVFGYGGRFVNGKPVKDTVSTDKTVVSPDDYANTRGYSQTLASST